MSDEHVGPRSQGLPVASQTQPRRRIPWKPLSALLLLPAAAALMVAGVVCRGDAPEGLSIREPMPSSVLILYEHRPAPIDRALALYRAADFRGVQAVLQNVVGRAPDDPSVFLLLGSAQLLADQGRDAVLSLRLAGRGVTDPALVSEARWQLAQGYLFVGELDPALDELASLSAGTSHRSNDARALLSALADSGMERTR